MSNRTITMNDQLYDYLLNVSVRESELLRRLRIETEQDPMSRMQIGPEQGQFMALMVRLLSAKRIIEVGVFTGYSSLCMAGALPEDGRIIACDMSEKWTGVARRYWKEARVEQKIDLRIAPALDTLNALINDGQTSSFDLVFIDADKENYSAYYECALRLLRTGGMILIDNTLWGGNVAMPEKNDPETSAIRELNSRLKTDDRIELSLVPIGDGLTMALKK